MDSGESAKRNKEQTKRKLINAVAEIFRTEGHEGLGVNKVAKRAGVSKKLIYRYFGGFDALVEAYVVETDYWMNFSDGLQDLIKDVNPDNAGKLIADVLKNQFHYFSNDSQMRRLIRWELCTKNALMRSIHNTRESYGQYLLRITDEHFKNKGVNFRAIAALLVGGIYYTVLHTEFNGSIFTDIDFSTEEGRFEITKAIEMIVAWAAGNNGGS